MSGYVIHKIAGAFGAMQIGVRDRALIIHATGRNYDTAGFLRVEAALVRLPINDAIRLHAMLAEAIVFSEEQPDTRQTSLWFMPSRCST